MNNVVAPHNNFNTIGGGDYHNNTKTKGNRDSTKRSGTTGGTSSEAKFANPMESFTNQNVYNITEGDGKLNNRNNR